MSQEWEKKVCSTRMKDIRSCDQCPKTFTSSKSFWQHKQIHIGANKYNCSQCEKSFSRQGNKHFLEIWWGPCFLKDLTQEEMYIGTKNVLKWLIEQHSLPSGRKKANWHENKWRRYTALAIDGNCYQSSPSRQRRLWLWADQSSPSSSITSQSSPSSSS